MEVVRSGAERAARVAAGADAAIVVVGDHPLVNGRETEDRMTLALASAQDAVVAAVRKANPRTVMIITSGYPLHPFGHGLSYTTFEYADLRVRLSDGTITAEATVTNTGDRPGVEVVQ